MLFAPGRIAQLVRALVSHTRGPGVRVPLRPLFYPFSVSQWFDSVHRRNSVLQGDNFFGFELSVDNIAHSPGNPDHNLINQIVKVQTGGTQNQAYPFLFKGF